ncbi:metal-dependent transcriptional regulator [Ktedonosporobacter rubrisoli]|uniref:Metal-dependent transcriptional regulator n=1 Tax=Ktedonosporobacter rubrisoli TaxID=2509675 RepID=A0A4P6JRF7_KTERU|nr:metal-dependent transcriptional regulator [Ktedonosporobacter rubrisoli]QBD77782.1 metal-dependent transcriptional regulator [Ktedonosporobacter rubrisoli]
MMKTDELLSATVEEYLESIYNISMEGEVVIGARLAEKFGVSAPTVTEMLKRLVRDGYVEMNNKRQVTLTEAGNKAAEAVLRRHRLTERFLVDMLGMQWHQVHEEACRLEHFISGAVEARVIASLNNPTTCPHGNPIPGSVPDARNYLKDHNAARLTTVPVGGTARILCISEVVEDEEALIFYLHEKGLMPEMQVIVLDQHCVDSALQNEQVKLLVNDHEVLISKASAAKIWVTL